MTTRLTTLGRGWLGLLESSLEGLARGGLDASSLWPSERERTAALERLWRLLDQVVTWNARIDLTAARDARELCDLYLADALVIAAHGARRGQERAAEQWLDIGSGAGAPGLVLGVLWPGLQLTLVEPRQKRVAFLRSAAGSLQGSLPGNIASIGQITVRDARSDALPARVADVALSRATFAPQRWLEEGARLARREVWVLLARAEPPTLPGWQPVLQVDYDWPLTGVARQALLFRPDAADAAAP